ncbi:MAG: hypothetical protein N3F66_03480 [Spirochaetes bacterium]|nr:hypothetical protein [Spirochaetota bacterium]
MLKYTKNISFLTILLILILVLKFISCKHEPLDEAASVVMSYLTTTDEKQLLEFLDSTSRNQVENMKKKHGAVYPFVWVHHDADSKWDVVKIEKTKDNATVTLQCVKHNKQNAIGMEVVHKLVKENGKWKIDLREQLTQP